MKRGSSSTQQQQQLSIALDVAAAAASYETGTAAVTQSTTSVSAILDGNAAAKLELEPAPRQSHGGVNDDAGEWLDENDDAGAGENPVTALQLAPQLVDLAQLADRALDAAADQQTPAEALLTQLGKGSRKTMRLALDRVARIASGGFYDRNTFPWGRLRYEHALWVRNQLAATSSPGYTNKCLAAFRGVMRQAFMMGLFGGAGAAEQFAKAIAIRNVKGGRQRRPRLVGADEWAKLYAACDASSGGRRDSAFLTLLRQGGERCWEAAGVDLADYDSSSGDLFLARGKGDKPRTVYISGSGRDAIAAWLDVRGRAPGPLLCPVDRFGRVSIERLSTEALRRSWQRLVKRAALAPCWPHCARATYITEISHRHGPHVAQQLAGHARLDQTAAYIVLDEDRKRRASEGIDVPFKR